MRSEGLDQAARVLRLYATARQSTRDAAELNAFVNLIYHERLNRPALDLSHPEDALVQVAERFSDILQDHLALETILLAVASGATGTPATDILDGIATRPQPPRPTR